MLDALDSSSHGVFMNITVALHLAKPVIVDKKSSGDLFRVVTTPAVIGLVGLINEEGGIFCVAAHGPVAGVEEGRGKLGLCEESTHGRLERNTIAHTLILCCHNTAGGLLDLSGDEGTRRFASRTSTVIEEYLLFYLTEQRCGSFYGILLKNVTNANVRSSLGQMARAVENQVRRDPS